MVFTNVVCRSFLGINLPFTEEYASLAMVPMAYLGLGHTLRQGRHISADIVISRVSERTKRLLLFISLFALAVLRFFLERGCDLLVHNWERNAASNGAMRTPMWIPSLIVVAGLAIFIIDVIFWIINNILGLLRKGRLRFQD